MVGTGTVTALFTDLVGSTELLQKLGDDAAQAVYRTHFELLREAISAAGGQEVKSLGDGLMVVFPSALNALGCAVAMQRAIDLHNKTSGIQPLSVRVGLHAGEPIREVDDFFGTAVVVARRLCDSADGGQIVASDVVRALVGSRGGFSFRGLGARSLKGLTEAVPASEVRWRTDGTQDDVARRFGFLRRPPLPVMIGLPIIVVAGLVGGVIALNGSSDEDAISGVTGANIDGPMTEKAMPP